MWPQWANTHTRAQEKKPVFQAHIHRQSFAEKASWGFLFGEIFFCFRSKQTNLIDRFFSACFCWFGCVWEKTQIKRRTKKHEKKRKSLLTAHFFPYYHAAHQLKNILLKTANCKLCKCNKTQNTTDKKRFTKQSCGSLVSLVQGVTRKMKRAQKRPLSFLFLAGGFFLQKKARCT